MRINVFNLKKRQEDWKEVKHALHQVWIGNQSGATLPMCCDLDFQKAFEQVKREKTLKQCQEILGL
jgi:hypothetical protein